MLNYMLVNIKLQQFVVASEKMQVFSTVFHLLLFDRSGSHALDWKQLDFILEGLNHWLKSQLKVGERERQGKSKTEKQECERERNTGIERRKVEKC